MALLADRNSFNNGGRIDFFMNEVAERGGIASFSTAGSGAAMDQAQQLATYAANPSGAKPIGILMNDMVSVDLTRQKLNPYKDEVQIGGKVTLWDKGEVVTNMIQPGITVTVGQTAYLHASGYVSNTNHLDHSNNVVGRFMSTKNQNGYAKLSVNLPNNKL
jgi:hypothetical protein